MKAGRPSATAEAMAAARAFGSYVYRDERILDDPFAQYFLSRRNKAIFGLMRRIGVSALDVRMASLYDRRVPGALGWILTRHRYFDDSIEQAAQAGTTQIVFVGAGYDSRAFRQQSLTNSRIFELDHPDTQSRKQRIVRRHFGALPKNVDYVGLNATHDDLRELLAHGFDPRTPALFVLEGFLWYMPPAVASSVLRTIAAIAAPRTRVIFDYILPSVVDGSSELEGAQEHRSYCSDRGEPILFGVAPEQLPSYLREHGFRLTDDVGHENLAERYTSGSRRPIKIYPFLRIATAQVSARS
jgi:methyltransferase (TIGR00027 family)